MTEITDLNPTDASNTALTGNGIQGTNFVSNFDNAMRSLLGLLGRLNSGAAPIADTFTIADPADLTKRFRFDGGLITAGQTRVITVPDTNITLGAGTAASITFTPAGNIAATDVQAAIEELDTEKQAASANLTEWSGINPSANGGSLISAADYAAMRALLDLEVGTDFLSPAAIAAAYQPLLATLTSWGAITRASGFDTFVATPSSANLRSLLTDETGTGAAYFAGGNAGTPSAINLTNGTALPVAGITSSTSTALGVGSLELGHASDTTLSRGAAGFIAVEGNRVPSPASQASGDTLYRGSTEWERLAKGTAYQLLRMNSGATAPEWATDREALTGNRTYYVRSDGSDSNTGLVNDSGGAFLTIAKAFSTISTLDLAGYTVTIQVGAGTWTASVTMSTPALGGFVILAGDTTTPSNVTISTSGTCITVSGGAKLSVQGFKLVSSAARGIFITGAGSECTMSGNMDFGATSQAQILIFNDGYLLIATNYLISGASTSHIQTGLGGLWECYTRTVTISGSPNYTAAFVFMASTSKCNTAGNTYSGTVTGTRYNSNTNAVINTNGGGASYFPGNAAGSTATGGIYA